MRTLSLIEVGPETYQGIIIEADNIYYHILSTTMCQIWTHILSSCCLILPSQQLYVVGTVTMSHFIGKELRHRVFNSLLGRRGASKRLFE